MPYSPIAAGEIDPGTAAASTTAYKFRDNPLAIADGAQQSTGIPTVWHASLSAPSADTGKILVVSATNSARDATRKRIDAVATTAIRAWQYNGVTTSTSAFSKSSTWSEYRLVHFHFQMWHQETLASTDIQNVQVKGDGIINTSGNIQFCQWQSLVRKRTNAGVSVEENPYTQMGYVDTPGAEFSINTTGRTMSINWNSGSRILEMKWGAIAGSSSNTADGSFWLVGN